MTPSAKDLWPWRTILTIFYSFESVDSIFRATNSGRFLVFVEFIKKINLIPKSSCISVSYIRKVLRKIFLKLERLRNIAVGNLKNISYFLVILNSTNLRLDSLFQSQWKRHVTNFVRLLYTLWVTNFWVMYFIKP